MTVGIYKLAFKGTDKVYIGQSINIEKRFREHLNNMRKHKAYNKLQEAFDTFGPPSLEIYKVCTEKELDTTENECIKKYNSVINGFNTLEKAGNPDLKGYLSPNAKYTKEVYVAIFLDLVNTDLYIKDIATKHNVGWYTVSGIANGTNHLWLSEEYPEQYIKLKSLINQRQKINKSPAMLVSPEGEVFEVDCSYREFARIHDIGGHCHLGCVINGSRKSFKGWTKYTERTE